MLTRTKKINIVKDLADKFKRQKIAIFCDFHGISVTKLQQLRRLLKKDGGEYKVAKKTLMARAIENAGISFSVKELKGELSVAFGYEDPTAPVKTLFGFSKENETFKILSGILGNRILSKNDVVTIANLPSRDVLIAQFVGVLKNPLRGLVAALSGNMRNLLTILNKIKSNKTA